MHLLALRSATFKCICPSFKELLTDTVVRGNDTEFSLSIFLLVPRESLLFQGYIRCVAFMWLLILGDVCLFCTSRGVHTKAVTDLMSLISGESDT